MINKVLLVILVILPLVFTGCTRDSVSSNLNRQEYKEESTNGFFSVHEETGDLSYSDIEDAYVNGWNDACDEVFWYRDDLYYDGYQYSYYDFYDYVDGSPYVEESYPDTDYPYLYGDEEISYRQGREAALDTIFWYTDVLCYGEERYYKSDY